MNLRGQKFTVSWSKKPEKIDDRIIDSVNRLRKIFGEPLSLVALSNGDVALRYMLLSTVIQVKRSSLTVLTDEEYSGVLDFDSAVKYVQKRWKW